MRALLGVFPFPQLLLMRPRQLPGCGALRRALPQPCYLGQAEHSGEPWLMPYGIFFFSFSHFFLNLRKEWSELNPYLFNLVRGQGDSRLFCCVDCDSQCNPF